MSGPQSKRYVALLRGINVGGKNKIEMKRLRRTFERAGMSAVATYINSGNVIFNDRGRPRVELSARLEKAVAADFGLEVPVLLRPGRRSTPFMRLCHRTGVMTVR